MILVTGGAGFIGANFVLDALARGDEAIVNLDALTYAGNLGNLSALSGDARHVFVHGDIRDAALVRALLAEHRPRAIVHFAAESHVDRSIADPLAFVRTNVEGTATLLAEALAHWRSLPAAEADRFRFLHVSTDEVFGSLGPADPPFRETTPYAPSSPYSASKAASDHLVRAWHHTYGLPTLVTNCSNNYGPLQFPEKLIPLMITRALEGRELPVYGDGGNVRDWLYVVDHCRAVSAVLAHGRPGQAYCVGGDAERTNVQVVDALCAALDVLRPRADGRSYRRQVAFVADRPGHDRRYAIDASRLRDELGWAPSVSFEEGLAQTVRWYLDNPDWVAEAATGGCLGRRPALDTPTPAPTPAPSIARA